MSKFRMTDLSSYEPINGSICWIKTKIRPSITKKYKTFVLKSGEMIFPCYIVSGAIIDNVLRLGVNLLLDVDFDDSGMTHNTHNFALGPTDFMTHNDAVEIGFGDIVNFDYDSCKVAFKTEVVN